MGIFLFVRKARTARIQEYPQLYELALMQLNSRIPNDTCCSLRGRLDFIPPSVPRWV